MKWISVKDRLPKINQEVLIITEANEMGKAWIDYDGYFQCFDDTVSISFKPTHWMSLPEPPEEVED